MKLGSNVMATVRGRGRSMSKICASRPGRGVITTTRSARKIASPMLWVTKTIVLLVSRPEPHQQQVHLVARERVERAERLVHQQQAWVGCQRTHDRGALLHAARELSRDRSSANPVRPTSSSSSADARLVDGLLLDLERQLDVLAEVAPGKQVRVLEHHPDLVGSWPGHGRAVEDDLAARQRVQAGRRPQQRRLAATAEPEDA